MLPCQDVVQQGGLATAQKACNHLQHTRQACKGVRLTSQVQHRFLCGADAGGAALVQSNKTVAAVDDCNGLGMACFRHTSPAQRGHAQLPVAFTRPAYHLNRPLGAAAVLP